jgi:hypothetical protein
MLGVVMEAPRRRSRRGLVKTLNLRGGPAALPWRGRRRSPAPWGTDIVGSFVISDNTCQIYLVGTDLFAYTVNSSPDQRHAAGEGAHPLRPTSGPADQHACRLQRPVGPDLVVQQVGLNRCG